MAESKAVREVTDSSFASDVLAAKGPVLVDFTATWCGPCQALAPVLESLAEESAGRVAILKLDVDANPETATRFGIRSVPTLLLFKDGQQVSSQVGLLPKARLKAWIDDAL
jgi:thioredoxin 1